MPQGLLFRYAARDRVHPGPVAVSDAGALSGLAAVVRMGAVPGLVMPFGTGTLGAGVRVRRRSRSGALLWRGRSASRGPGAVVPGAALANEGECAAARGA